METSKEKQIEKMIKELCVDYGTKCGGCGCISLCAVIAHCKDLYNVGYRKQSKGEWLDTDICAEDMYCSVCGGIAPVDCEKEEFYKSNFCPNCGAKMKGGAE